MLNILKARIRIVHGSVAFGLLPAIHILVYDCHHTNYHPNRIHQSQLIHDSSPVNSLFSLIIRLVGTDSSHRMETTASPSKHCKHTGQPGFLSNCQPLEGLDRAGIQENKSRSTKRPSCLGCPIGTQQAGNTFNRLDCLCHTLHLQHVLLPRRSYHGRQSAGPPGPSWGPDVEEPFPQG